MWAGGDNLTQARMIDFSFIFPERSAALSFAGVVDDKELRVCIHYYQGRQMWDATVSRLMVPDHGSITVLEAALTLKAELFGGKADGWGCFRVPGK